MHHILFITILAFSALDRSESPSQAFLIIINWLLVILKQLSPSSWGHIFLAYDNMCHVDSMNVAKKPLSFESPYDNSWLSINKIIDSLHIRNHKDPGCRDKYDPAKLKELLPDINTMAAEQTFVWLSRFKKILCAMPKVHHLFYLHRKWWCVATGIQLNATREVSNLSYQGMYN